jgi:exopolysaccharide biosynthesis WecB/TagA/CpsF family protein
MTARGDECALKILSAEPGTQPRNPPVALCGVPIHGIGLADAVAAIESMVEEGTPHHVVTANLDGVVLSRSDPEWRRILQNADLVLADGMPLVWASRWKGAALPERVAGADLVPELLALAEARGYRVFWLGGTESAARGMTIRVANLYPRLLPLETHSPPPAPLEAMDLAEIQRRIRRARPHVLLVSFGCPKQEKWIARYARDLQVPVSIGVGATIDFLSGRIPRAPAWMRAAGLEWCYRLCREPRRLGPRYARDLRWVGGWIVRSLRDAVLRRTRAPHPGAFPDSSPQRGEAGAARQRPGS